jgi:hypothetical protein
LKCSKAERLGNFDFKKLILQQSFKIAQISIEIFYQLNTKLEGPIAIAKKK